jgi:hypothetical protein
MSIALNPWVKMRRKAQLTALAVQEGDEITWSGIGGRERRGVVVEVDEEDGTLWAVDESGSKALVDIDKVRGKTGQRSPLIAKAFRNKKAQAWQLLDSDKIPVGPSLKRKVVNRVYGDIKLGTGSKARGAVLAAVERELMSVAGNAYDSQEVESLTNVVFEKLSKKAQLSSVNVGDKFLDASDNIYRITRVDNGTLTYEVYSPLQKNWLENSIPVEEFVNEYAPAHHMKSITDAEYDKLFEVLRRGDESEIYDTFRGMYDSKTAREAQTSLQIGDKFEFTDDEGDKAAEIIGQTPDGNFEVQFSYRADDGNIWTSPVHPLAIERDVESEYWKKAAGKKLVTLVDVLSQSVKDRRAQAENWGLGLFSYDDGSMIETLDTMPGDRQQAVDVGIQKGWDYLIDHTNDLPIGTYVVRIYDADVPTSGTQEVVAKFEISESAMEGHNLRRVMGKVNHWAAFSKKALEMWVAPELEAYKTIDITLPDGRDVTVDVGVGGGTPPIYETMEKMVDKSTGQEVDTFSFSDPEFDKVIETINETLRKVGKLNHWAAFSRRAQVTDSEKTPLQVGDRVKDISFGDVGEVWEIDESTGQVAVRYDYGIVEVDDPSSTHVGLMKIAKRWNRNAMRAAARKAQKFTLIDTGQHSSTGKWWARGHLEGIGEEEQWGDTEEEALNKLRDRIENVMGGEWPTSQEV